jgi:hypothetical protein
VTIAERPPDRTPPVGVHRRPGQVRSALPSPGPAVVESRGESDGADRQLAVLLAAAAATATIVGPPVTWVVSALVALAALLGASAAVAGSVGVVGSTPGGPIDRTSVRAHRVDRLGRSIRASGGLLVPGLLPAVLAGGGSLALHALPVRLELLLGIATLGVVLSWSVGLERRLSAARTAPSDEDVALVLALSLGAAFLAFVGVGTVVPGGLSGAVSRSIESTNLGLLVGGEALAAGVLGLRMARLRAAGRRNAVLGGASSAAIVAVAAGALRALAIPFLLGPALLTLVFFLWDAVTGSTVARRRSPRWAWEIVLLAILGLCVVLLNLRIG